MQPLAQLITELEKKIPEYAYVNAKVSKGSVGWHIEHTLLTLNLVMEVLKKSDPAQYKTTFDWRRIVVLTLGIIPRGKVKAPKVVQPVNNFNAQTLAQHVWQAKQNLESIRHLPPGHYFTHPFLGDFKVKPALKFLKVHTRHHLHIINDILHHKQHSVKGF